jgi:VCBS repeat-containing protein
VANTAFDQLLPGDNPTEVIDITVSNNLGQNFDTTLTLNLHGAADAPVITSADVVGSLTEDAGPAVLTNGDFENGLTGWTVVGSDIHDEFIGLGGQFGNFSAVLGPPGGVGTETLSQGVATTAGTHYLVSFTAFGDPESGNNELVASWNGHNLVDVVNNTAGGPVTYSFDVVGDGNSDPLSFTYKDDGNGIILDNVSVTPQTGPATESTSGHIAFSDIETGDTHTVSVTPDAAGYVGTFTVDPVTESSGNGSTNWHFTVDNSDIQFLSAGQVLTQTYTVGITDENGATVNQDIAVALTGTNDPTTAVGETVVSDAGAGGTIDIPTFALTSNDTDPDTADHLSVSHVVSASGGITSNNASDVFFFDNDATPGGSFDYQSTDGISTSNTATATIVNNATNASTLTAAASGDSILIATNGTETLQGGSGNDVLIGNSGSHMMSGGAGNDTFAFLNSTDGPDIITDFNNTTEHDHIAVSANGYGGPLTAGMDASSIFQTSSDNQTNGVAGFVFDTANQTLYFSADGSQASEVALAQVQMGATINPHDILIV